MSADDQITSRLVRFLDASISTRLFDLPHPPSTALNQSPASPGSLRVPHPMTAETLRKLSSAMEAYRGILPLEAPNGESDPWWTMARANMLCAEMLLHAEEAIYQPSKHELAVRAARRMVGLIERLRPQDCTHLGGLRDDFTRVDGMSDALPHRPRCCHRHFPRRSLLVPRSSAPTAKRMSKPHLLRC